MDSKDHDDREPSKNTICSLEWIALAMDAARRYKETEQTRPPEKTTQLHPNSD
jgi:hypothetical protein